MLWTKIASALEGLRVILLYCFFILPNDERETADEKTLAWLHMTINTSLAAAAMLRISELISIRWYLSYMYAKWAEN